MGDLARDQLDDDIAHAMRVEQMLLHLATVVESKVEESKAEGRNRKSGSRKTKRDTYPTDAEHALTYGAHLARRERENLEHVRAIYDGKVQGTALDG